MAHAMFISHGSPEEVLRDSPARRAWDRLGPSIRDTYRAIVVMSAHDEHHQVSVGWADSFETIDDFGAIFDRRLRDLRYPARGDRRLAASIGDRLMADGISASVDHRPGLDHGAWTVLSRLDPAAVLPIVPLGVMPGASTADHHRLGAALADLPDDILVLGSGALTHRLQAVAWGEPDAPAHPRTRVFADWIGDRLAARDDVLAWEREAPHALWNHPTPEHLYPLFFALGAAGPSPASHTMHRGYSHAVLAMDAYALGGAAAGLR
ncbi:MAG: class III extradiol ring-cleavage dioxygenase [Pseudomonadota bacterium]